ncbi:MAG: cytochrome c oxidase assembly factor 1 family protein [Acidobacteriota bacterium]
MADKTSPWVWVGIGCAVILAGMVAFVAFIVFVVFGSMRSSDPYKEALQRARNDPRVIAALGTPIEPGLFVSGSINTQNQSGTADLSIPISGPKQSASIHVVGTKEGGRWTYTRIVVTPKDGPVIDLLEGTVAVFPVVESSSRRVFESSSLESSCLRVFESSCLRVVVSSSCRRLGPTSSLTVS